MKKNCLSLKEMTKEYNFVLDILSRFVCCIPLSIIEWYHEFRLVSSEIVLLVSENFLYVTLQPL